MKRGEVRLYKFKSPDKKRPVVILTRITTLSKEKLFELHNAICFALNLCIRQASHHSRMGRKLLFLYS